MTINFEQMALSLEKAMVNVDDMDLAKRLAVEPLFMGDRAVGECNCGLCGDGSEYSYSFKPPSSWSPEPIELKLEKIEDSEEALSEMLRAVCEGFPWVWIEPWVILSAPPDESPRLISVGNQPWNPKFKRLSAELFKPDRDW
jgi:hypothetical protein